MYRMMCPKLERQTRARASSPRDVRTPKDHDDNGGAGDTGVCPHNENSVQCAAPSNRHEQRKPEKPLTNNNPVTYYGPCLDLNREGAKGIEKGIVCLKICFCVI